MSRIRQYFKQLFTPAATIDPAEQSYHIDSHIVEPLLADTKQTEGCMPQTFSRSVYDQYLENCREAGLKPIGLLDALGEAVSPTKQDNLSEPLLIASYPLHFNLKKQFFYSGFEDHNREQLQDTVQGMRARTDKNLNQFYADYFSKLPIRALKDIEFSAESIFEWGIYRYNLPEFIMNIEINSEAKHFHRFREPLEPLINRTNTPHYNDQLRKQYRDRKDCTQLFFIGLAQVLVYAEIDGNKQPIYQTAHPALPNQIMP